MSVSLILTHALCRFYDELWNGLQLQYVSLVMSKGVAAACSYPRFLILLIMCVISALLMYSES